MTQDRGVYQHDNWNSLLHELHGLGPEWVFRGQKSADWPLSTSLERAMRAHPVMYADWRDNELRDIRYFKRRTRSLLSSPPAEDDAVEWLVLMQHYGAPTRLLDWTHSPSVAAYFAFEDPDGVAGHDGLMSRRAVWALDTQALKRWHDCHPPTLPDYLKFFEKQPDDNAVRLQNRLIDAKRDHGPGYGEDDLLWRDTGDELNGVVRDILRLAPRPTKVPYADQHEGFTSYHQEDYFDVPLPVESRHANERVVAQADYFTAGVLLNEVEAGLKVESRVAIKKYCLPNDLRPDLIKRLARDGFDRARLFPGLDGIGKATQQALMRNEKQH